MAALALATSIILVAAFAFRLAGLSSAEPLEPILLATGEWAPYSGSALPRDPILFKPNQIPQNAAAPAAIGVIPNCGNPKKIAAE